MLESQKFAFSAENNVSFTSVNDERNEYNCSYNHAVDDAVVIGQKNFCSQCRQSEAQIDCRAIKQLHISPFGAAAHIEDDKKYAFLRF
jgi:hypothetical protein